MHQLKLLSLVFCVTVAACGGSNKNGGAAPVSGFGAAGAGGSRAPSSGGSAGHAGRGGTSNGGVAGSGGAGNAAGQSGSAGSGGTPVTGGILGPVTDDQAPIIVDTANKVFATAETYAEHRLLVDGDGNIYRSYATSFDFLQQGGISKYDSALAKQWDYSPSSSLALKFHPVSLSCAADGSVFFGGSIDHALAGETFAGGDSDAVVGKLNPDGTLAWAHQWGSSLNDDTNFSVVTSDGAVIFAGPSSGQAPGNPPTVAGGPWLARYEADGSQTWLKQYDPRQAAPGMELMIDALDNTYLMSSQVFLQTATALSIMKIDPQGELLTVSDRPPMQRTGPLRYAPMAMAASGDALYSWDNLYDPANVNATTFVLAKYDTALNQLAQMVTEPPRSAVLAQGLTWTGNFSHLQALASNAIDASAPNAVFLVGSYTNEYANGAVMQPTTTPVYIGRYDLSGQRQWFQELFFDATPYTSADRFLDMAYDASTTSLVVTAAAVLQGSSGTLLFKLNAADGTVR